MPEKDPSELPGMRRNPWVLTTPGGKSVFRAFRDITLQPPALVVRDGEKEMRYHLRCLDDLYEMLKGRGGRGRAGQRPRERETGRGHGRSVGRSAESPVGGWYG